MHCLHHIEAQGLPIDYSSQDNLLEKWSELHPTSIWVTCDQQGNSLAVVGLLFRNLCQQILVTLNPHDTGLGKNIY